jgi:hypothetical protein
MENQKSADVINLKTHQEVRPNTSGFYQITASIGDTISYRSIDIIQKNEL